MENNIIPIFFACDEKFVKFTYVTIKSILENRNESYFYKLYILNTNVTHNSQMLGYKNIEEYNNVTLQFIDVSKYIEKIKDRIPLRDYYSNATYYRLFIADMFPEYDKAIYIDSDTIVKADISTFFNNTLGNNLVGACHEQAMLQTKCYGDYVEKNLGLNSKEYFNAGFLLINLKAFRDECLLDQFSDIVSLYECRVTQDEDYLNILTEKRVTWIEDSWNTEVYGEIKYDEKDINMIHYIMWAKPWHFIGVRLEKYFWEYAKLTVFYDEIKKELENYTEDLRNRDLKQAENLMNLAINETNAKVKWVDVKHKRKAVDRLIVLSKIRQLENEKIFDQDVEDDPVTRNIEVGEVDYTKKKLLSKIKTRIAYFIARKYLNKIIRNKQMIIKDIKGIENLSNLDSGAFITCNHFNAFDSFAIQVAYEKACKNKRKFYRVIREGNYTTFPGFFGFLMRNCYTLPLATNKDVVKEFIKSTNEIVKKGDLVLVYPEQSMWWNYRKPKPLKKSAFQFAAKANVPVVPVFITMNDSSILDTNGFFVQEYTINILKPIYPDSKLSNIENTNQMMEKNYLMWKEVYENAYGIDLKY